MNSLKASKVYSAGLDGFSFDMEQNYCKEALKFLLIRERMNKLNAGMRTMIETYKKELDIEFLKTPKFLTGEL